MIPHYVRNHIPTNQTERPVVVARVWLVVRFLSLCGLAPSVRRLSESEQALVDRVLPSPMRQGVDGSSAPRIVASLEACLELGWHEREIYNRLNSNPLPARFAPGLVIHRVEAILSTNPPKRKRPVPELVPSSGDDSQTAQGQESTKKMPPEFFEEQCRKFLSKTGTREPSMTRKQWIAAGAVAALALIVVVVGVLVRSGKASGREAREEYAAVWQDNVAVHEALDEVVDTGEALASDCVTDTNMNTVCDCLNDAMEVAEALPEEAEVDVVWSSGEETFQATEQLSEAAV